MYFVDRSKIEKTLAYMEELLKEIRDNQFNTRIEQLGLERSVHLIIESMMDVGNMMIDGFIMRDPGSYHDIIDIMIDERVIPKEDESSYKKIVDLRQMLVQDYLEINDELLAEVIKKELPTIEKFKTYIITYLNDELDVANAFSKED